MGWQRKVLRVDLTKGTAEGEPLNMDWAFGYLGERSFADRFAADRKRNAPVLRGAESQGASLGQPFEAPLARHAGRDLSLANTPAVVADERNVGGLRSQTDADALAPSDEQRRLYALAYEQMQHNTELLEVGLGFLEYSDKSFQLPDRLE